MAHGKGFHRAMSYFAEAVGYRSEAIEPEDERAQLQRMFSDSVRQQAEILRRMQAIADMSAVAPLTRVA